MGAVPPGDGLGGLPPPLPTSPVYVSPPLPTPGRIVTLLDRKRPRGDEDCAEDRYLLADSKGPGYLLADSKGRGTFSLCILQNTLNVSRGVLGLGIVTCIVVQLNACYRSAALVLRRGDAPIKVQRDRKS